MEVMLQIENLSAGYGKDPVIRDVNLTIPEGCICALIGQNGSGKTTLMRCINTVLKPLKGRVTLCGKDMGRLKRAEIARLISVVPQTNDVAFPFSCLEMILMGGAARLKAWASPGAEEGHRARKIAVEMGFSDLLERSFNCLSGGQKQLVMLARALYQDTPVMLLDEPNAHLDFCNQHRIMAFFQEAARRRHTTALVTLHDPNLALNYCDSVILLREGRVIAQGPTRRVMDDEMLKEVLGENIRIDTTARGLQVVVPRIPASCVQKEAQRALKQFPVSSIRL